MSVESEKVSCVLDRWREYLREASWYMRLEDDLRRYLWRLPESDLERKIRWAIYDLVAEQLDQGAVAVGHEGIDWDIERKPIRYVVLHHSGTLPDISLSRLSAMGLLRLYAPVYLNAKDYPEAYGHPVYSNHWRGGHPVFYGYHWLVRRDGTTERLLDDDRIGWHAGNWDINCSSVGLCLAGDYSSTQPPEQALQSLTRLIRQYSGANVLLHFSVNPKSTCPGTWATNCKW